MVRLRVAAPARFVALSALVVLVSGCFGGGGDDASDGSVPAVATTTLPLRTETPFCAAMNDLAETIETDPPDDITALVIERYEAIQGDVPPEIRPEFDYVLASLRGDPLPELPEPTAPSTTAPPPTSAPSIDSTTTTSTSSTTTTTTTTTIVGDELSSGTIATTSTAPPTSAPFVDEFILPNDTPAERLADYVDFTCRGRLNNPGPPATQPNAEPPSDDDL